MGDEDWSLWRLNSYTYDLGLIIVCKSCLKHRVYKKTDQTTNDNHEMEH